MLVNLSFISLSWAVVISIVNTVFDLDLIDFGLLLITLPFNNTKQRTRTEARLKCNLLRFVNTKQETHTEAILRKCNATIMPPAYSSQQLSSIRVSV